MNVNVKATLKAWPEVLLVTLALFGAIPLWAAAAIDPLGAVLSTRGQLAMSLTLFCFWLSPVVVVGLMLTQRRALLAWFFLHCLALVLHLLLTASSRPVWLDLAAVAFIAMMAALGQFLLGKDVLFPFLSDSPHAWRKAPRLATSKLLKIVNVETGGACHVIVADASLSGLGLYGAGLQLGAALAGMRAGDYCELVMGTGASATVLDAKVKWMKEEPGNVLALGVSALEARSMQRFLRGLTPIAQGGFLFHWLASRWVNRGFRLLVIGLWACSFLGTHMISGYTPADDHSAPAPAVQSADPARPLVTGH